MKKEAFLNIEKFSAVEQDVILSFLAGADFIRMSTGTSAITSSG
jgi:hypothetical protein